MPYKDKEKQIAAQKKYYLNNKNKYKKNVQRRRKEYKEWFLEIKEKEECEKCGEDHPGVLDYHHNGCEKKEDTISNMVNDLIPKKKIIAEIEKCIILCSNCHRKLHWYEHKT